MSEQWLQEGIQAARAGNKKEAARLFYQVVKEDPENQAAWLYLSDVLDDMAKKREILTWLLENYPDNQMAKSRLMRLDQGHSATAVDSNQRNSAGNQASAVNPSVNDRSNAHSSDAQPMKNHRKTAQETTPKNTNVSRLFVPLLVLTVVLSVAVLVLGYLLWDPFDLRSEAVGLSVDCDAIQSGVIATQDEAGYVVPTSTVEMVLPTETVDVTETSIPTATLIPTETVTPLPQATATPRPEFQEDFDNGLSAEWYGNLDAMKLQNGRMGMKSHHVDSPVIFGESFWNNYEVTLDACVDDDWKYGEGLDIYIAIQNYKYGNLTAYQAAFGDVRPQSKDTYFRLFEWTDGDMSSSLDSVDLAFDLWSNQCNTIKIKVVNYSAEIYINNEMIYRFSSVYLLNGAVGLSVTENVEIDNIVIRPID